MLKTAWRYSQLPPGDLRLTIFLRGSFLGRQLAPDKDVLMKYKNGELDWDAFTQLYLEKIQKMWDAKNEAIMTVARFVHEDKRTLWLVCWEAENNPHCHRHLLKRFLEEKASELITLQKGVTT